MQTLADCRSRPRNCCERSDGSAGVGKVKLRGRAWVEAAFTLALTAYNVIRPPKLLAGSACAFGGRWHVVETPGHDIAVA